jgi:ceramide synthetase
MTDLSTEIHVLMDGLVATMTGSSKSLPMDVPSLGRDAQVFAVFAVALFAFNWGFRLLVVAPVLSALVPMKRSMKVKFEQSVMEAIFYGTFAVIGVSVIRGQTWLWPSSNWWQPTPEGHEIMRSDLRCYYLLYIARYFQAGISVVLETKRKDFIEMMLHHIVTVCVGTVSYCIGCNRVGVVVMVLLDFADVPLHLAKCCKYMSDINLKMKSSTPRRDLWLFVADRLFEMFAITFFVTRLVMYGYVCWSAHIEQSRHVSKRMSDWICVACLYTLLGLQVYWFFLILKVAAKLLRGEGVEDPRSDDEDDCANGVDNNTCSTCSTKCSDSKGSISPSSARNALSTRSGQLAFAVACVYTLLVLQLYALFLMLKVPAKLLRGEGVEGLRSDDEDDCVKDMDNSPRSDCSTNWPDSEGSVSSSSAKSSTRSRRRHC